MAHWPRSRPPAPEVTISASIPTRERSRGFGRQKPGVVPALAIPTQAAPPLEAPARPSAAAEASPLATVAAMLEAARRRAEEAALDRIEAVVEPDVYADLRRRVDDPAQQNARLERLLRTPAPWDPA